MYKVEIVTDTLQQAAIERRRRLDEERKNRIFNPKMRIMGIDVQALEEQIKIKSEIQQMEKERNVAFDQQAAQANTLLTHLDNHVASARRSQLIELNDFRQEKQQPFQRRDFDLYDPEALRKEQPARVSDEDERLKHRSNLQMFEGEDLKHQERSLEQKKQMRCWALQGMWERELKKRENQRETAEFVKFQNNVDAKSRELLKAAEEAKSESAKRDKELNQKLAEEKKLNASYQKEKETEDSIKEIIEQINGPFLTEKPATSEDGYPARVDLFKGFTESQKREILMIQEHQRREAEFKKLKEREREYGWAIQQDRTLRATLLMDQEKQRKQRELAIQIRKENEQKAIEDRERQKYVKSVLYTNRPEQSYFDQFNKSSR